MASNPRPIRSTKTAGAFAKTDPLPPPLAPGGFIVQTLCISAGFGESQYRSNRKTYFFLTRAISISHGARDMVAALDLIFRPTMDNKGK